MTNSGLAFDDLTRFWGKLGAQSGAEGYHPLICHMIDVAAVAGEIWDSALSQAGRDALRAGLDIEADAAARAWVVFLAGAHDLGKACPALPLRYVRALKGCGRCTAILALAPLASARVTLRMARSQRWCFRACSQTVTVLTSGPRSA